MTEPPAGDLASSNDLRVAQAWIDALTSGACDEAAFLRALPTFTRDVSGTGWDLLSLIDQHYRRGNIASESYRHLKSHLESRLMRPGFEAAVSVPLPRNAHLLSSAGRTVPNVAPALTSVAEATEQDAPVAPPTPLAARSRRRRIAVGDLLRGRYLIKGVLGRGGMGTVFEAVDQYRLNLPNAGQSVAVKVLHAAVNERPELHDELRREFQHLQSLSHPNIVRVHEYDRDGDIVFFTMELLRGCTLAHALFDTEREGPSRTQALSIIRDVGAALAFAHAGRVVHGDLNPRNIFITDDGAARVLDFGSSHWLREKSWSGLLDAPAQTPIATPRYASCQVLEGDVADERDDVFALACIVYLLLAGAPPFGERTALEARTLNLTPARPYGMAAEQWNALLSGLAFDRAARPSDVQVWLAPFKALSGADPIPAPHGRYRLAAWIATALAALTVGWWAATKHERTAVASSAPAPMVHEPLPESAPLPNDGPEARANDSAKPQDRIPQPQDSDSRLAAERPAPEVSLDPALAGSTAAPPPPLAASRIPAVRNSPGRSRIELAASTLEVPPLGPTANVVVRRSGNLQANARFSWWTESGTAKPGQDFAPVTAREVQFESGKSSVNLFVPIIADSTRRETRSFYVMIGDPSDGASLGARTLMMVTVRAQQ